MRARPFYSGLRPIHLQDKSITKNVLVTSTHFSNKNRPSESSQWANHSCQATAGFPYTTKIWLTASQ